VGCGGWEEGLVWVAFFGCGGHFVEWCEIHVVFEAA
jgi:hypothetical protein